MSVPYLQGSKVKADITFFETQSGGAVFSTGSISYAGSLSYNNYNNDICKITTNVLKRFADPLPFEYPEHAKDLN
jgi:N,N-dimethylformamidase